MNIMQYPIRGERMSALINKLRTTNYLQSQFKQSESELPMICQIFIGSILLKTLSEY